MNSLDWNLLKSFITVVELGSLSKAAKELRSSQPTIGRHIDQLEQDLDVLLFDRTSRGYVVTELGVDLAKEVRKMRLNANMVTRLVEAKSDHLVGTVRLSASHTVSYSIIPDFLKSFKESYPQIQIEISVSDEYDNLLERKADIALRMVRPAQKDLTTKKVCELGVGIYVSKSYPRFRALQKELHLGNLKSILDFDLIGQDEISEIIEGMEKMGISAKKSDFIFRTDNHLLNYRLIEAGLGAGFSLDILTRDCKGLVNLLGEEFVGTFPIWLTAHREIKTNPRMRLVFDELSKFLNNLD